MAVLTDYIRWRGDLGFNIVPFNETDAMLFSELAYLPWECTGKIPKGADPVSLAKLIEDLDWTSGTMELRPRQKELAELTARSSRYSNILVQDAVNEVDHDKATQFSAVSFTYDKKKHFIAFRGTDSTIAGWKENLDLAYEEHVPAQLKSVAYLRSAASRLKGSLMTGGHSKGGNLAVYSAAFSPKAVSNRIKAIYNFDGPGFNSKVAGNERFLAISDRIHTYVPQDSVIGMLLEQIEDFTVIHSTERGGLRQHLMDSWEVGPDGLVRAEGLSRTGEFSSENLDRWISGMSFDEKKTFINVIFGLAESNNIRTVDELLDIKNFALIMNDFSKLDKNDRQTVSSTFSGLGGTFFRSFMEKYGGPITDTAGIVAEKTSGKARDITDFAKGIRGKAKDLIKSLEDKQ